ncbi:MAG TPA: IS21 family transposase [Candidatus Paceibacterota bacterium]|nr:IS21 family transposase [Candidatus Paceibacterota bacterium]
MIDYHTFCEVHRLVEQEHLSLGQIACRLHLAYQTVEKWAGRSTFQKAQMPKRPSKLDTFKGQILAWLQRHPYTAQQVFQQLKAQGYAGGYSILKEFVRQVRPVHKPAYLKLEFAPGECAQVDWGSFGPITVGSTRRRLSFFVMVLCYSRLMYVEFTLSEGMEQFLTCHRHALEFFGSVPRKVMIDNLKVGVLQHPLGQSAQFHPRYLDFAAHYGFQPVACTVKRANEKGRVESAVGYVKKNFLHGLDLPGFVAVNPAARQWLDTVANVRLHRETRRKPLEHFAEEKPHLKPLALVPYDCAVVRPSGANGCCRVVLDTNRYTVPPLYASQKLSLKLYPDQLLIYHQEKLIATHVRSYDRRRDIQNPDHVQELVTQRQRARDQTLLLAFLQLGPQAELYARKLQEKRLHAPHHIQKIVALSQSYGPDKVVRALQDALSFEAYGCEYIANILEQRQRLPVTPSALHLTHRQDLLDLDLPPADLTPYEPKPPPDPLPPR